MSSQEQEITRVSSRIRRAILEFCAKLMLSGRDLFYAEELRKYVTERHPLTAPSSADRILRMLRRAEDIDYVVLNRSKSLYRLTKASIVLNSQEERQI